MNKKDWTDDQLLLHLLNHKSNRTRWEYISVLRSRPSEELFLKCVDLIKSRKPKERSLGIDILAQFGAPPWPFLKRTLKLYFHLLDREKDPKVLISLFRALGHSSHNLTKAQINKLCSLSDRKNKLVREGLVFSLLGIDHVKAIETLIKLSSDRASNVRNWATFGIGTQIESDSKKVREALWDRVSDNHQETKLEAIVGLAKRKDDRVGEIIILELLVGEYGTLLFEAIQETGDKQFLPLLRQNLKSAKVDKGINPEWLSDLKKCIAFLTKGKTE